MAIPYPYPRIHQTLDYPTIQGGDFPVLQGDDRVLPAWLAPGYSGTVAGAANVFPEPLIASDHAFPSRVSGCTPEYAKVTAGFDAMKNVNVACSRAGPAIRGFHAGTMKAPLQELDEAEIQRLREKPVALSQKNHRPLKIVD